MPALSGAFNQKQTYKSVPIKNAYRTILRMRALSPFLSASPLSPSAFYIKELTHRSTPWRKSFVFLEGGGGETVSQPIEKCFDFCVTGEIHDGTAKKTPLCRILKKLTSLNPVPSRFVEYFPCICASSSKFPSSQFSEKIQY
jgi:hypothetical protein